jgi:hypothetical protein
MATTRAYPRANAIYTQLRNAYPALEIAYGGRSIHIGLLFK